MGRKEGMTYIRVSRLLLCLFLLLLLQTSSANEWSESLRQLHDQKNFVNLDFKNRKAIVDRVYDNLDRLDEQQQLEFFVLASQVLKHETTQQVVAIINQGLTISSRLDAKSQHLYFSLLKLRLSSDVLDDYYLQQLKVLKTAVDQLPDGVVKAMAYIVYARISDELENRYEQLSVLHAGVAVIDSLQDEAGTSYRKNVLLGELCNELGAYYSDMTAYAQAHFYFKQALKVFTRSDFQSKVGIVKFNLARLAYHEQQYMTAEKYLNEVVKLKMTLKENYGLALSYMNLAQVKTQLGEAKQAINLLNQAIPMLRQMEKNYRLAFAHLYLAQAKHALHQHADADTAVLKSLSYADDHMPKKQRVQIYQAGLEILDGQVYAVRRQEILSDYLPMQAAVTTAFKQDLHARIEAEVVLSEEQRHNKLTAKLARSQEASNTLQKQWILVLLLLILILLYSVFKQIKVNKDKTLLADTDHLTGVFNRRYFYRVLENILHERPQSDQAMFLLLFDIDHFKTVNDQFGHTTGDWVLVEICRLIESLIEDNCGHFARIGGEEFALVCHFSGADVAKKFANSIRRQVSHYKWSNHPDMQGFKLTVSIGLTALEHGDSMQDLINRADQALYRAKSDGRNRVEVAAIDGTECSGLDVWA